MAKRLQLRGGTTVQHSTFIGAIREVTVDTDKQTLVVHDGVTAGGVEIAKQSVVNSKIPKVTTPTTKALPRIKSDGTLENSAITIDDNGNIGTGAQSFNGFGGSGFKNCIINGNFDVWQRGLSGFVSGYFADRWLIISGVSDVSASQALAPTGSYLSAYLHRNGTGSMKVEQRIEAVNARPLVGKKATLSFNTRVTQGTLTSVIVSISYANTLDVFSTNTLIESFTLNPANNSKSSVTLSSVLPANAANGISVTFEYVVVGDTAVTMNQVQLEQGLTATPSEKRPYGLELSLCKRYLPSVEVTQQYAYSGGFLTSTYGFVYVPFEVEARVRPTGILLSTANVRFVNPTTGAPIGTGILFAVSAKTGCALTSSGVTTAVGGQATCLTDTVGTTKILFTGCEL